MTEKKTVLAFALAAALAAAGGVYFWQRRPAPVADTGHKAEPATLPVLSKLPEFVLQDQDGRSFDLLDLRGKVWVADFIFTRATANSPAITQNLLALEKEVDAQPSGRNVRFISFTIDPEHDSKDVLAFYAEKHGARLNRWKFLRGTREALRRVVGEGFKLPLFEQDQPEAAVARTHSFAVVDRLGQVRGLYDALTDAGRAATLSAVASLEAEAVPAEVYVPSEVDRMPAWMGPKMADQVNNASRIVAEHDFRFSDEIGASGITFRNVSSVDTGRYYRAIHYDHGTAVAVADTDGDGLPDLFFVNQVGPSALYRNLGHAHFQDVTAAAGIDLHGRACVGASFADIDNDGAPDLFVTCIRDGNLLFHNDGHGKFTDITASAGVAGTGGHSSGAVFFDYDGDGLLDLFVTNVGQYTTQEKRPGSPYVGLADAFAGHLHPERSERSILYRNLGGGRFEDVTERSGLTHTGWSGEATALDYDDDGKPDLYVLSMQGHDTLWHNLGNGKFQDTGRSVFSRTPWGSMGVKVFDWNADGKPDLFVTDMHTDMASELQPEDEGKKHDPATMFPKRFLGTDGNHVLGNALFTNRGGGEFLETSDYARVETGWPWGPSVADLNADGFPDVFIASGMNYPFRYQGNRALLNQGGTRFADAEFVLGIEPRARFARPWFELECDAPADAKHELCKGASAPLLDGAALPAQAVPRRGRLTVWAARASRSAAIVDLDGDGDLDIVTNNDDDVPQLLISDLAQRHAVHFVKLRLRGTKSNRDGLGAVVTVTADGRRQVQWNDGKSGYLAQSSMPLYFGLGHPDHADSIEVRWPSGKRQVVRGPIASGSDLLITER